MRKKKIDHKKYDTTEYWNQLLADAGLSVERGRHPNLVYVGDSKRVELIDDLESTRVGRSAIKPQSE